MDDSEGEVDSGLVLGRTPDGNRVSVMGSFGAFHILVEAGSIGTEVVEHPVLEAVVEFGDGVHGMGLAISERVSEFRAMSPKVVCSLACLMASSSSEASSISVVTVDS